MKHEIDVFEASHEVRLHIFHCFSDVDAQNQRGLWYNRKCQVCDLRLVASITSEDKYVNE